MESIVDAVYEDFNHRRKLYAAEQADKIDNDELLEIENVVKNRSSQI